MNEDELRSLIEQRWVALETEPPMGERRLRVAELSMPTDGAPLAVAVDNDGHRHLLVPIHSHIKVRTGLDGPVLQLRRRPLEDAETYGTYADLGCLRDDLKDLFTELCVDVLEKAVTLPENPVKALYRVLDRWRSLFRTQGPPLGTQELAGLFGELTVLNRLLATDPSAHRIWRGPDGYRHDFSTAINAVEVKASTSTEGRRPRVHGLDQLEAPGGGALCLAWFRLHRTTARGVGSKFVDSVEEALRLCDDEGALLELLARAGFRLADADLYEDVCFAVGEERWYRVDRDFPGLTGAALAEAGVAVSALDVEYTIDLSGEIPTPMKPEEVSLMIEKLTREPA
ncbi:PD-(D/E)XK motif protein [Streptomyces sp. N35]|uniref:PD-(D/E)XK motif protein n=1 Tax=Streptomyces sp. N35 TaxID=2795730 RepID=UPI0018F5043F|nr:PD-(D/E)XK motif protein [Streptomyces sp. N35]